MSNPLYTALLPIAFILFVARLFQYVVNKYADTKTLGLIVITTVELAAIALVVISHPELLSGLFLFLMVIATIIINTLHVSLDKKETDITLSKEMSGVLMLLVSWFVLSLLYFGV